MWIVVVFFHTAYYNTNSQLNVLAITATNASVFSKGTLSRVDPLVDKGDGAVIVDEDEDEIEVTELVCEVPEED